MKALVTSGCSFSEISSYQPEQPNSLKTWPIYIEEKYNPEVSHHAGVGSCGNDLISRKAIYWCNKLLETYDGKDITCIVEYSGPNRFAVLSDDHGMLRQEIKRKYTNPRHLHHTEQFKDYELKENTQDPIYGWNFINHWTELQCANHLYINKSFLGMVEETLWNMLNVKNFCAVNNINYFWTTMQNDVDKPHKYGTHQTSEHWTTSHLYKLVYETDNRITNQGMYEWILERYSHHIGDDGLHPDSQGHERYASEAIIPFIENYGKD